LELQAICLYRQQEQIDGPLFLGIDTHTLKEKGNINTPLELAINNQVDRFSIAMDVIDRVPELKVAGAHDKEKFRNEQIACCHYAHEHGIDRPEMVNWKWPY
jgi:xylulose-5-phosphate/fructose-6-phosphate phosphoketolase